jgi:hypothetical protein
VLDAKKDILLWLRSLTLTVNVVLMLLRYKSSIIIYNKERVKISNRAGLKESQLDGCIGFSFNQQA